MKLTQTIAALLTAATTFAAQADAITDWNIKSGEIITEAKIGTPPAVRIMAIVQTAALDAVNEAARRDRNANSALTDAAVAAAHRGTLLKLLPAHQAAIDAAYQAALASIADTAAASAGVAIGEKCAADVLAQRADDGASAPEAYRPHTTAGAYVPTAAAAVPQWAQRKP
jgi:hypothetical protein